MAQPTITPPAWGDPERGECVHGDPRPHRCALCRHARHSTPPPVFDRQRAAAGEREDR